MSTASRLFDMTEEKTNEITTAIRKAYFTTDNFTQLIAIAKEKGYLKDLKEATLTGFLIGRLVQYNETAQNIEEIEEICERMKTLKRKEA